MTAECVLLFSTPNAFIHLINNLENCHSSIMQYAINGLKQSKLCLSDILNIQSWPKELNDLSVFSSLTTIQGRSLYK